jgi:hypothetical protein
MTFTQRYIQKLFQLSPILGFIFIGLFLFGTSYFLYLFTQVNCTVGNCVGMELYSTTTRYLLYFSLAGIATLSLVLLRALIVRPSVLTKAFSGKLSQSRRPEKSDNIFFWVTFFAVLSLVGVPNELIISKEYTYCYETSGEYRKDGQYFDRTSRGFISSALYVTNTTQCPDRNLFMYWYDEQGREFESFDTHPDEVELQLSIGN